MSDPIVPTRSGKVSGARADGVLRFLGIPYGADTSGTNRFRPPQPAPPWAGVRPATTAGPVAPQADPPGPMGEDCLVLNVWTASLDGRRPVLFWIHGGGFFTGSGLTPTTDGAALARTGEAVVVSVNHRLALFGFLDLEGLGDESFDGSGNAGMLDLVAALEWVRDNIAGFGGDPDAVTIFGHSGGGAKVATLMSMPAARGLFRTAVVHGGPPFGLKERHLARRNAELALERSGLKPAQLRDPDEVPTARLLDLQRRLGVGGAPNPNAMRFAPSVGHAAVPAYPEEAFAAGWAADVTLVAGTSLDEARFAQLINPSYAAPGFAISDADLHERVRPGLDDPARAHLLVQRYRELQPGSSPAELMFDILSDQFRIRTDRLVRAKLAGGGQPAYMYLCEVGHGTGPGAFHGMEMPFFFATLDGSEEIAATPQRRELAATMSGALLALARTGRPGGDGSPVPHWPPFSVPERAQLLMSDRGAEPVADPYPQRRSAWDGFVTSPRTDPWARLFG